MYQPTLFRDRPRPAQVVLGGVVPAIAGAIAGVLVGVSSGAYWGYAAFVAIGSVRRRLRAPGRLGRRRPRPRRRASSTASPCCSRTLIAGTHAKVSLGSFPPLLAVITAIAGMLLSALGGRIARGQRERAQARATIPAE